MRSTIKKIQEVKADESIRLGGTTRAEPDAIGAVTWQRPKTDDPLVSASPR